MGNKVGIFSNLAFLPSARASLRACIWLRIAVSRDASFLVVIFFPVAASSKSVFGTGAVTVRLGCLPAGNDGGESVVLCRGRMALDRVAEAIRANPFRVVVLDGVDHADNVVQGSIAYARSSPAGSRTRAAATSPSAATSSS